MRKTNTIAQWREEPVIRDQARATKYIKDNRSLKRSHDYYNDTVKKIKNNVLKRSLTSFCYRTSTLNELDDVKLLDFATRNYGERLVWGFHGRNFNQIPLIKQQKEELDGGEYQAMKLGHIVYFSILIKSYTYFVKCICYWKSDN